MARRDDDRPVTTGILALAGVGLVVGLLISGAVLAVTQVLGLGGSESSGGSSGATSRESMYLPSPAPTEADTGPAITLAPVPGPGEAAGDGGVETTAPPAEGATPAAPAIALSAGVSEAGRMQEVPLTGTYPGGAGATLQIERFTGGAWTDFPVDVRVDEAGTFSTYIRTSQTGSTQFRLRDVASGLTSNEVSVTIT